MKDSKQKALNVFITVLPFLCIISLWAICSASVDNGKVLPSVIDTVKEFFNLFTYDEFYTALLGTVARALIAFIASFTVAFLLAFLSKKFKKFRTFISPVISVFRALPTIAVVLLLIVWTNSQIAPVIVTMLVVLPTVYTNIVNAFEIVSESQIEMCKVYKVPVKTVLLKVQIPQMMPEILTAIGAGLSLNLKLMVAAEVIAYTSNSIGHYLSLANLYDATATLMALVLAVILIGLIIESLFTLFAKKTGVWK